MLKFFWYTITFKKNDYFGRIDKKLDYLKLKKKKLGESAKIIFQINEKL